MYTRARATWLNLKTVWTILLERTLAEDTNTTTTTTNNNNNNNRAHVHDD